MIESSKVNKPLQGMAPTESTPSACLLTCLHACLPACLLACLLALGSALSVCALCVLREVLACLLACSDHHLLLTLITTSCLL